MKGSLGFSKATVPAKSPLGGHKSGKEGREGRSSLQMCG